MISIYNFFKQMAPLVLLPAMKAVLVLGLMGLVLCAQSQNADSVDKLYHFNGGVTVTNNGISLIPSFSLGKPAVIVDLSMGNEKLSFDPQFRFALEGRPWSFIFWGRYKMVNNKKFRMHIGAHPALMFHELSFEEDGISENGLEARRFVAAEISPSISLTKHISLMPYYLIGHGFDRGLKNTHYLTMRTCISKLEICKQLQFSITPELYYLKMDANDGFYFASAFSLKHKKLPVSLAAMINKKLDSEIESKDFLWNISLTYPFDNKYLKNKK